MGAIHLYGLVETGHALSLPQEETTPPKTAPLQWRGIEEIMV